VEFIELPEPTQHEMHALATQVASGVECVLEKHGLHLDQPSRVEAAAPPRVEIASVDRVISEPGRDGDLPG
jgi:hypothetical protein